MLRPGRILEKALIPRSIFGRALLIVLVPLVISQIVATAVFFDRHWDTVSRWLANGFAGEVAMIAELVETAPDARTREALIDVAQRRSGSTIVFKDGAHLAAALEGADPPERVLDPVVASSFDGRLPWAFFVDLGDESSRRFTVYLQLENGLLEVTAERKRITTSTTRLFVIWTVAVSVLLILASLYLVRRTVRPMGRLARAMESFGKGWDIGDFRLEGATEIRRAGHAFNLMRRRLLRFLQARTDMLAAVSHDLRTPLTRMRLELELIGGDRQIADGLRADVDEMSRLIDAYLDFARGEGEEKIEDLALGPLLEEFGAHAARSGLEAFVEVEPGLRARLREGAIRRCLNNLIGNAARFARTVRIVAWSSESWIEIRIEDDGPGIPPAEREEAIKPFVSLAGGRRADEDAEKGGVGLGLAIVLDVALAHGGSLHLGDSSMGGLAASLRLPR